MDIYTTIINDPILITITVILAAIVLYSCIKKLFKVALVVLALIVVYIGILYLTGQPIPQTADELLDMGKETYEKGKEAVEKTIEDATKEAGKNKLFNKDDD